MPFAFRATYQPGKTPPILPFAFRLEDLYIAGMAKKNNYDRNAATQGRKEYEKHTCGECARCTPVMKFHTLTVKDRRPTLGRCPEYEFCVLLSQPAGKCFRAKTKEPGSV